MGSASFPVTSCRIWMTLSLIVNALSMHSVNIPLAYRSWVQMTSQLTSREPTASRKGCTK